MIFLENIKNEKGAISAVHAIVVTAVMLTVLFLSFFIFNSKIKDNGEMINEKIVSEFEDDDFILTKPIELPIIENDIIDEEEIIDDLETEKDNEIIKQIFITLERNKSQEREVVITLPNLNKLIDIKSSNNGLIDIVSINEDEVKIKITDGKPNDYIVLSGAYTSGGSKLVDMQENEDYSDIYGYKGTLNRYLASYRPPETIIINNYVVESMTNNFPTIQKYTEKNYTTDLVKKGNSIATIIKGSPNDSKEVASQENMNYIEKINDNGIETNYKGTLTQYVHSGEESIIKTVNHSESSYTNSFPNTKNYNVDSFAGILNKTGSIITMIDKGSISHTKTVEIQSSPSYTESIYDNGVQTYYSGTLSEYVYQGSISDSKFVSNQLVSLYKEPFNDNSISTNYTGTLTQYVASGYAPDSKTHTITEYNYTNAIFPETKTITDGLYNGTINKNGSTIQYSGGSAPISKYVSGQLSSWYNDGSYSGSLSQYLVSGSTSDSKYVSSQSSSWYNDGVYSGSLSSYLAGGSASDSKYLSGQSSSWYNDGTYSGSLSQYLYSGSAPTNITATASSCSNNVIVTYRNYVAISRTSTYECPSSKTATAYYDGKQYSATAYKSAYTTKNCGETSQYSSGTCTEPWTATYNTTIKTDDTRIYRYQGTVYKPDTRYYLYAGTVYKPDTRTYAYQGTVWTPDTRYNYWTQVYSGTIYRPDSRIYRHQGTVTKPDTRIYKYRGIVTKPDTRIYKYTQNYSGIVKTPDTRVWKYRGTVTKPDTRVYKYSQIYAGILNIPEESIYKYKGIVTKDSNDTRVIENYYKYDLTIKYSEENKY